ncbi:MAG: translation initiation factor IF-2 subunit alpha [Candidatus Hadarchaeales archaeon]
MVRRRTEWPSIDELVICTVREIFPQGAFVALDEYGGKEGMVHISEVASGWIKNIRDHVRENQKVVCTVLDVNPARKKIDLSIRRVKDNERKWKIQRAKLEQRGERLLELCAQKLGKNLDAAYEEVGFSLQERFGDLYSALEVAASDPQQVEALVGPEWAKVLHEVAKDNIQAPSYRVTGELSLTCPAPNGAEVIKTALLSARNSLRSEETDLEFYYIGAPKFRIEVSGRSYKSAESVMKKAAEIAADIVAKAGGRGEFKAG